MSQSTLIAGGLIFAFVIFLAARNRLAAYGSVLWGAATGTTPAPTTTGPGVQVGGSGATTSGGGVTATTSPTVGGGVAANASGTVTANPATAGGAAAAPVAAPLLNPINSLKQAFTFGDISPFGSATQSSELNAASELGFGSGVLGF